MKRELNERIRVQTVPVGLSLTKQSFKDECDVNNILKKWQKTGLITHVSPTPPKFGEFDQVVDYQVALNQVMAADSAFMALPSSVRDRFGNDPSKLFAFLNDSKNRDEAISLGLVDAPSVLATPPASSEPSGAV